MSTMAFGASPQMSDPQRNAERKNLPPAIEIGQRSGREQKARIDEIVGVDHPLQRVHASAEDASGDKTDFGN
jgi:hypothetical protein